jgi:hypothetical protein
MEIDHRHNVVTGLGFLSSLAREISRLIQRRNAPVQASMLSLGSTVRDRPPRYQFRRVASKHPSEPGLRQSMPERRCARMGCSRFKVSESVGFASWITLRSIQATGRKRSFEAQDTRSAHFELGTLNFELRDVRLEPARRAAL